MKFSLFFFLIVGGSQKSTRYCKNIFLIKAKNKKNIFVQGVSKVKSEGVNKFFSKKRGIRNQKLRKVKKFQAWVVRRFFEYRAKAVGGGGFHPLPYGL